MSKEEKFEEWKEQAIKTQQLFYNIFGDRSWDVYKSSERQLLEKNVGYALYGLPEALPTKENEETGYCKRKLEQIKKICGVIVEWDQHEKASNETWVAVLFVCLNESGECRPVPVFRVPKYNRNGECSIFIDYVGRVYRGWNKFLNENCLSECKYCYPKDGIYVGDENYDVLLEFGDTPACKTSRKVLDVLDKTNTGIALGGTVIGLVSLTALPVAAPVIVAGAISSVASFMYGTSRSVGALIDKKKHGQSIGLSDGEARGCYLSVVGGALGMASGIGSRWVARVAQNGELMSKTSEVLVTALNISSLATNGVGIVNNSFLLREKVKTGDLSCLAIFQFTSSVLFFTSAVVNVKTANAIIKETQESTLKNFEESLTFKKHKKLYRRMAKNTITDVDDPMYGKAKVIKAMQHIDNTEEFFSSVNKIRRDIHETSSDISFGESGTLTLNRKAQVNPTKFSTVHTLQRREVLTATKDLHAGTISQAEFGSLVQQSDVPLEVFCSSSSSINAVGMDKMSLKLVDAIKAVEAHTSSLLNCAISLDIADYEILLQYAERLCSEMGLHKVADVVSTLNFIVHFINDVANSMEKHFQQDLLHARESYHERFSQHTFDEDYGKFKNRIRVFSIAIMKNLDKLFLVIKRVYDLFVSERVLDEQVYDQCSNLVLENMPGKFSLVPEEMEVEYLPPSQKMQNERTCEKFKTFNEEDCQYWRERDFSAEGDLRDEELHEIASLLTGVPVCEVNAKLVRDGSVAFVTANPASLFHCVMVVGHVEDKIVSASLVL